METYMNTSSPHGAEVCLSRPSIPSGNIVSAHVIEGDALRVLPKLPPNSFGGLFTDPPYSSGGRTSGEKAKTPLEKYRMGGTKIERPDFDGDHRDQRSYFAWSTLWLAECYRLLKPGSVAAVFTDWRQLPVTTDAFQAAGFLWLGIVPWDKTEGCRPTLGRFAHQCEYVVWGSKGRLPSDRPGIRTLPGLFRHSVKQSDKFHLTGKPTGLLEDLLRIVPVGETILDPFAGSATTGVGAIRRGCSFLGIDQSSEYVAIGRDRLSTELLASGFPESAAAQ